MARSLGRGRGNAFLFFFFVALALLSCRLPASLATVYDVGGDSGWSLFSPYSTWLQGKTFTVGDSLFFKYPAGGHDVVEVSKADYDNCESVDTFINEWTEGNTVVQLTEAGDKYYVCSFIGHCPPMRIAVTVVAAPLSSVNTTVPTSGPSPTTPPPKGEVAPPATPPLQSTPPLAKAPQSWTPLPGTPPPKPLNWWMPPTLAPVEEPSSWISPPPVEEPSPWISSTPPSKAPIWSPTPAPPSKLPTPISTPTPTPILVYTPTAAPLETPAPSPNSITTPIVSPSAPPLFNEEGTPVGSPIALTSSAHSHYSQFFGTLFMALTLTFLATRV